LKLIFLIKNKKKIFILYCIKIYYDDIIEIILMIKKKKMLIILIINEIIRKQLFEKIIIKNII